MTWAFALELRPATAKFVLVALADNADDEGRAFPSVDSLASKTSLDRKTVMSALDQLEQRGVVSDTGQRVGRTKQVKVYRLAVGSQAAVLWDGKSSGIGTVPFDDSDFEGGSKGTDLGTIKESNSTENGTGTKNGTVPFFPSKGTVFPVGCTPSAPSVSLPSPLPLTPSPPSEPSGNRQSARARRCPEGFVVTEAMREWARSHVPEVNVDTETEKFRDHEYRDPKKDWPAAWRTWMRNSVDFSRPRSSASAEPKLTWRPGPDD